MNVYVPLMHFTSRAELKTEAVFLERTEREREAEEGSRSELVICIVSKTSKSK